MQIILYRLIDLNSVLSFLSLLMPGDEKPPHRCSMQGRKNLRGTTLVLHVPFQSCFKSRRIKTSPLYGFLGRGSGGNRSLASKERFPPEYFISKGNAPSFSGYRRCPAGAERACLRVLRGHVPACPAAAFHLPRLSLGAPARYSPLPRMQSLSY